MTNTVQKVNRLPLSLVVAAANTYDIRLVADTLDALQTGRPGQKIKLCLDKGYDAGWLKTYLQSRRYEPHIQSRKEESDASKNKGFKKPIAGLSKGLIAG